MNTEWLKTHWYYVAGGLIGLFVVYEILTSATGGSSSSSTDLSGAGTQLQALQASADLTNAQVNGQVVTASYQADVVNNQTAAALQLGEVQTAAELAATQGQTSAAVALGENTNASLVEAQQIITGGQVQQTQIEGNTLENLATTAASIPLAQISTVNSQISNLMTYSKNFGSDIKAIAPVIAEETGQGGSAGSVKQSAGSTTAQNISAVSGGIGTIGTILSGLFG